MKNQYYKKLLISPFFFYFVFSLSAGLFIQLIFLPYIFPSLHWYDGLIDFGDWIYYHEFGKIFAQEINDGGWGNWQLKPKNWGILGLISAIYAFTGIYKPFVLLPVFSLLNAFGCLSIYLIIKLIFKSKKISFIATIPFLLVPSSFLWVTQIMKDVFTINAILMLICAYIYYFNYIFKKNDTKLKNSVNDLVIILLFIIISTSLFFLIRPYILYLSILYHFIFTSIFLCIFLFKYIYKKKIKNFAIFIFFTFLISINFYVFHNLYQKYDSERGLNDIIKTDERVGEKIDLIIKGEEGNIEKFKQSGPTFMFAENTDNSKSIKNLPKKKSEDNNNNNNNNNNNCATFKEYTFKDGNTENFFISQKYNKWQKSIFLPDKIDAIIKSLYLKRLYFILYQSCSNTQIDFDRDLNSLFKIIGYFPRLIQITYFTPFPSEWFKSSNNQQNFFYNLLSSEMIVHYILIFSFIISFFYFYKNINFYMILFSSIFFSSYSSFFFPNIGAIVRYRHAGLILISCVGLAVILYFLSKKNHSLSKFLK